MNYGLLGQITVCLLVAGWLLGVYFSRKKTQ